MSTPSVRDTGRQPLTIALAGFGTVGQELAHRLTDGVIPEARLVAISALDLDKARRNAEALVPRPAVVTVAELPAHAEVVVECATGAAFPEIARLVLEAGRTLVPVSVGALASNPEIVELARRHGGRIRIASGAMLGLDAVRGAAEGDLRSVRLTSRVRPDSLVAEAYVIECGFDFRTPPTEPIKVFEGSAGDAARAFPNHFNVAVTLGLAGLGLDRTAVEVWADPTVPGAIHHVEVEADHIGLSMTSRNRPSATNPRTSRSVAPSVLAALRSLSSPLQIGS